MGILGLLFRGAREAIQEKSAKNRLEGKLGRKVSKEELYSLGSHLDAAQPDAAAQMPFQPHGAPRAASVPFGDAKPPMKTRTKLIIGGVLVLLIGFVAVAVAGFAVLNMSQSTYNRLNPFTPKPSAADFPAQIGRFSLSTGPEYSYSEYSAAPLRAYFHSFYKADDVRDLRYYVYDYKTADEARAGFEAKKKEMKGYQGYQHVDDTDTRFASVWLKTGSSSVLWLDGTKFKYAYGIMQKPLYEFEGLLKNAAPAQVVEVTLGETETPRTASSTAAPSLTVTGLLDEYKKDAAAADKKYKDKIVLVSGTVEVSDKDKKGNWMIAFMRPGSTAPKDGMVICGFDKSQEKNVSGIKKGDLITLRGKVSMNLIGSVMLENCTKF